AARGMCLVELGGLRRQDLDRDRRRQRPVVVVEIGRCVLSHGEDPFLLSAPGDAAANPALLDHPATTTATEVQGGDRAVHKRWAGTPGRIARRAGVGPCAHNGGVHGHDDMRAAAGRAPVDALQVFSPATAAWFREPFAQPTPAQAGAWQAIADGQDTLVVAPTGSGKTLAAFLTAIDALAFPREPATMARPTGTSVLYISPLKALGMDVERNLTSPLVGTTRAAERLGLTHRDVTVGVRTGDTPA